LLLFRSACIRIISNSGRENAWIRARSLFDRSQKPGVAVEEEGRKTNTKSPGSIEMCGSWLELDTGYKSRLRESGPSDRI